MSQGGPNSPFLFRRFLTDLILYLKNECGIVISESEILLHLLWADDLILLSDTPQGLQTQLDGLYQFCKDWHMLVNETKTKIMIFGAKNTNFEFRYNNKILDIVSNYKYLGTVFNSISRCDSNMFTDAYERTELQSRKAMFKILKDTKHLGKLPPKVALKLFDAMVLPILEYSSEIWFTNKEIPGLEKIHLQFIKMILGVHKNASTLAVLGETGRYPLLVRQKIRVLKYWCKIVSKHVSTNSTLGQLYNILCSLSNAGFTTWASYVENMLTEAGLYDVWLEQTCNQKIVNTFKTKVYTSFENEWRTNITNVELYPKLRTYCTFKHVFSMEQYLLCIKDFKIRKLLTKFRICNHVLMIEKGRHCKPKLPIEQRLCTLCDAHAIEDEYHFLCVCTAYDDLRRDFVDVCTSLGFHGMQNNFNLLYLLNNVDIIFQVGKLLSKMFALRQSIVGSR